MKYITVARYGTPETLTRHSCPSQPKLSNIRAGVFLFKKNIFKIINKFYSI